MYATVLTHRPLKVDEIFTVRCDARDKRRHGAWVFGATAVAPDRMEFPKEMTRCVQGKHWIYNENKIYFNKRRQHEVNIDLDDLKVSLNYFPIFLYWQYVYFGNIYILAIY